MKKYSLAVWLFAIMGSIYLIGCSKKNERVEHREEIPMTAPAQEAGDGDKPIIDLIDRTMDYCLERGIDLQDKDAVNEVYLSKAKELGYPVDYGFTDYDYSSYSDEFKERLAVLNTAGSYEAQENYISVLRESIESAYASSLSQEEKNTLVFNLQLTIDLLNYAEQKSRSLVGDDLRGRCRGWWSCWGKCVAGTLGGLITGAVGGGLAGAAVGTVTLPVVGTVSGAAVGVVGGGIGGALTGAAASC